MLQWIDHAVLLCNITFTWSLLTSADDDSHSVVLLTAFSCWKLSFSTATCAIAWCQHYSEKLTFRWRGAEKLAAVDLLYNESWIIKRDECPGAWWWQSKTSQWRCRSATFRRTYCSRTGRSGSSMNSSRTWRSRASNVSIAYVFVCPFFSGVFPQFYSTCSLSRCSNVNMAHVVILGNSVRSETNGPKFQDHPIST